MRTYNLVIYHCLSCGGVMHCPPDEEVPQCCGRPMIKAAAETVSNEGAPVIDTSRVKTEKESPAPVKRKPR